MGKWIEEARLDALRSELILDTPPERAFDEITRAAAQAFGVPMAAVSLVDRDRQWFKSSVGLGMAQTPRHLSFCAHAVRDDKMLVVPDATRDPRFADNDFVVSDPSVRFYAGAVIRSENGVPLGALCVLDCVSRPGGLTAEQASLLQLLADQVSEQIRLRRIVLEHEQHSAAQSDALRGGADRETRLLRALSAASAAWWEWDIANNRVIGSPDLARQFGVAPALARNGAPLELFLANVHPLDRSALDAAIRGAIERDEPFHCDYRTLTPKGTIWTSARGTCMRDSAGKPSYFSGVLMEMPPQGSEKAA